MNRIIISVTNDLVTDQRVIKTCACFNELGYEILLIGRKLKNSPEFSFPYKTKRFKLIFNHGFLFYAEYNMRLFVELLFRRKTILYANDLDTLLPNYLISRMGSSKLIYDSHEYFTEVPELISRPRTRSFWLKLEATIFPRLKNVITVNYKIAEIYKAKYKVPVTVIRNIPQPFIATENDSLSPIATNFKFIIYQGSLNIGRGLELMINSMLHLKDYKLLIAGDGDIASNLKTQVERLHLQHQIVFLGRVSPDKLKNITRQAELGLSLEEDLGLNYRYCLPNKIFDYIHAGIPVLVSNLPLLKEMLAENKIGACLSDRDPKALAAQMKNMILNKATFSKGIEKAKTRYDWNIEKKKLVTFINGIE